MTILRKLVIFDISNNPIFTNLGIFSTDEILNFIDLVHTSNYKLNKRSREVCRKMLESGLVEFTFQGNSRELGYQFFEATLIKGEDGQQGS